MRLPSRLLSLPFCAVVALSSVSVSAQVYKWVDERGVVNYANELPKDAVKNNKAAPVPDGRVSVVPAPRDVRPQAPAPSASAGSSRPERDVLRDRIELLERELELERRQRAMAADDEAERKRRAIEQCLANRGTNCDTLGEAADFAPAVVVPRLAFARNRQPQVFPAPTVPVTGAVVRVVDERRLDDPRPQASGRIVIRAASAGSQRLPPRSLHR